MTHRVDLWGRIVKGSPELSNCSRLCFTCCFINFFLFRNPFAMEEMKRVFSVIIIPQYNHMRSTTAQPVDDVVEAVSTQTEREVETIGNKDNNDGKGDSN
nr:hypothetical protein [Tanacetum cinerariifolium]